MRTVFIGFLFLVAIWIGWGAPVPGLVVRPIKADERIPTMGQAMADRAEVEQAAQAGRLAEEKSQRAMRQRVVDAANRLEAFPCDAAARRELRTATAAFMKEQMRRVRTGKDGETVNVSGRNVDASAFLNREVSEIVEQALFQGVLRPEDLPFGRLAAAQMAPLGQMGMPGRFTCETSAASP